MIFYSLIFNGIKEFTVSIPIWTNFSVSFIDVCDSAVIRKIGVVPDFLINIHPPLKRKCTPSTNVRLKSLYPAFLNCFLISQLL